MTTISPLDSIDWTQVGLAIREHDENELLLPEYDLEAAAECVWSAVKKWLIRDVENYDVLEVENKKVIDFAGKQISYVCDLKLRSHETNAIKLVDWKTTSADSFARNWNERYLSSWQGPFYAHFEQADEVEFRGITRGLETRALAIPLKQSSDLNLQVTTQLTGTLQQIEALTPLPVWPKNTSSCNAFGRECEMKDLACFQWRGSSEETLVPLPPVTRLSYSAMSLFELCPERFRLSKICAAPVEERGAAAFGSAVHRGLAVVYNTFLAK